MRKLLVLTIFLIAGFAHAETVDVCAWDNSMGLNYATDGYNWGGGAFSTLEECSAILRATMIVADFGSKPDGAVHFVAPSGQKSECQLTTLQYPFTPAPEGFIDELTSAYEGKSSAQQLMSFKSYLDANMTVSCK